MLEVVDVVEVVTSTALVEDVVVNVVDVEGFALPVPTSLLAVPNGEPSGAAALQPTK
ncbi:hypothetical protein [Nannocystis bainbridge]|uniref:Uncharacterized protein n=1 Tax=Nannocystis bainbridge TaxID=2995303 RepID=A0ABT5DUK0_9BACT|nr:hypothetical protein [Nannocystis bainbridge]MDC0717322.1 hypothetical protein [Nannocystis bainbridge]